MKFYEDEIYIEMCRKADEIQAESKCRYNYAGNEVLFGSSDKIILGKYRKGSIKSDNIYNIFIVGWWGGRTNHIWLPRLDQLIDMLGWTEPGPTLAQIDLMRSRFGHIGDTWENCFLRMVMEYKHGKHWDFDKKEWVKI